MTQAVHVLAGRFESREEAVAYTEPQWEPEPGDDVSDEQYAEWENRNPTWALCTDLGIAYLDSDFIETIDGPSSYSYLEGMLVDGAQIQSIRERAPADANILVLIFHPALGGFPARVASTPRLVYCGEWLCSLELQGVEP
jgi:hypothetical protein